MANTTNLNLYKPTRDDYISVSRDISENMQKIDDAYGAMDTAISNLDESRAKNSDIAIVVTGSTSTKNISIGDFVVVKDSTISGITDGLYVATTSVVAGTNITSSNLSNTNTGNGGFNVLNSKLKLGSWSCNVTLPYEAPTDGFISIFLNPSTTSGAYARFSISSSNAHAMGLNATSGEGVSITFPIRKGAVVSQAALSNGTYSARFISIFG